MSPTSNRSFPLPVRVLAAQSGQHFTADGQGVSKRMNDPRPNDTRAAQDYVKHIRNPHKRQYAGAYLGWRLGLLEHQPEPRRLSYMAAQAVRMHLNIIVG